MDTVSRRGFLTGLLCTPAIIPFANLDKLPSLSLRKFVYTDKDFADILSKRLSFSDMVRDTLRRRMVDLEGNINKNNALIKRFSNPDHYFHQYPDWMAEYEKVRAEHPNGVPFKPLSRLYEPDEAPWDIKQRPENGMDPHQYWEYRHNAAKIRKLKEDDLAEYPH